MRPFLCLLISLIASPAHAVIWLDPTRHPLRQICSNAIPVGDLDRALAAPDLDVYRTLRLEYPSGVGGNEADLTFGRVQFKLRRFKLARGQPANVVSLFARRTATPSVLEPAFEEQILGLSESFDIFDPLINDSQSPHVDAIQWIKLRGLDRWREVLGDDFLSSVHEDIAGYLRDGQNIFTWSQARRHVGLRYDFARLLREPFVVFALGDVSLILAAERTHLAICVPRDGGINLVRIRAAVEAWRANDRVARMLECEAALN